MGQTTDDGLDVSGLVADAHQAAGKLCIAVTGGGTQALAWLFAQPGASRTVMEAIIPYAGEALDEFTGVQSEQHVSVEEVELMTTRALERAVHLAGADDQTASTPLAGVSCTAAIATDRTRRGENRCHVGLAMSTGKRKTWSLVMNKDDRDRAGEEDVVSRIVLNAIAEAKGIARRVRVPLLPGEQIIERVSDVGT
jgi:nicotinamide mononucleotide (NMN) deamidase PncC